MLDIFYATVHVTLRCYFRELLFATLRDIEDVNKNTEKLKEYCKDISIAHRKTQSISSNFE